MSESMVEEVARAIARANGDDGMVKAYLPHARAAIAAMRAPTSRMVDAYFNSIEDQSVVKGRLNPLRAYTAMIDEALLDGN